ncbi:spinster family MFS transporter [Peristeroidobacter soli]|uniref:spinster family MFS transporter n=1 Tax=Peristeroidobacter soli TaxID=2497877 RepID=UPI00101B91EF|nr:MFS transporter [Peristeroidobacter soli]
MKNPPITHPSELYSPVRQWSLLAVLFLVSTSNFVDRNIISVLLEPIKAEFGVSDTLLGLLTGISFAVFYATLGIPVARLADRGNRKIIITLSLTIWSVMTALCGLAQSFWQLALARVGVGAGEAGALPPAQSLIADYFGPTRCARALAIFMSSSMCGYLLGFVAGAHIATMYGWRAAFLIVGLPGLALAVLVHFVLHEPRTLPQFRPLPGSQESLGATFRALAAKRSFVYLVIAMVIYFLIAYGGIVFLPSYMVRVLKVTLAEVGTAYGAVTAAGSIVGTVLGGFVTDRLSKRNIAWLSWWPALGLVLCWPLYEGMLLAPSFAIALTFAGLAGIMLNAAVPAMFACLHAICGSARRAMAVAVVFFFANLLGLGLGPVLAGAMSDAFSAVYGPVGIRYALLIVFVLLLPCAWLLVKSARHVATDVEA